jgi:hypothetical protein
LAFPNACEKSLDPKKNPIGAESLAGLQTAKLAVAMLRYALAG